VAITQSPLTVGPPVSGNGAGGSPAAIAERTRRILGDVADLPDLIALYRDLHKNPELSRREVRTSALVAAQLAAAGASVTTGVGETGVVAILTNGDGPRVMLRADMDALPVLERTGLDYASTATAEAADGGRVPVMHACGHDVHMAALAGAVRALARGRDQWRGTIMAVAQPAEETAEGAAAMLRDGLFERFGRPDVALAQHVDAFGAGQVGHAAGLFASGAVNVDITIRGRGGHGASPESCIDPIVVACFAVLRLQTVVASELGPAEPAVLTVGMLHAGAKANVIPDEARLAVNLRFQSDRTRQKLLDSIGRIVTAECRSARCPEDPEIRTSSYFPVTRNDEAVTAAVRGVHEELFGARNVLELPVSMGSEDFSFFGIPDPDHGYRGAPVPYCYWEFGGHPARAWEDAAGETFAEKLRQLPGCHSARFGPEPRSAIRTGLVALTGAALAFLEPADRTEGAHEHAGPA
jgi:amidohydrolase